MSLDRAKTLLASSDVTDNRNGVALVINAAATSANVPEILSQGIINLLLPKLRSDNADLVMKACWAVNNLCVHEKTRDAIYQNGVLEYMPAVLRSTDPEVLKKAAWALTNLSRSQQAQKDLVRHGTFRSLIGLLTSAPSEEVRGAALQPLCNLVLDAENQNEFLRQGGVPATVALLSSREEKNRELAVTLVSFVTTNHDSVRDALVDAGALRPLKNLVEGAGTPKEQEYAINSLVNISLSDHGEGAIADQGVLPAVVGLLSASLPKLRQQSAMLLSNLLTNRKVREKIRYIGWVDPVLDIARGEDPGELQQILRVVINIAFDGHCRALLVKRGAERVLTDAQRRVKDPTVQSLSTTALKNLSVPVASDVQGEVDDALASGKATTRVAAPEARQKAAIDDLAALDALVGDIAKGKREHHVTSPGAANVDSSASRPAPQHSGKGAGRDLLDELITDLPAPSRPVAKASPAPAKASPASAGKKHDPLDDLLSDLPPPRSNQAGASVSVSVGTPKKETSAPAKRNDTLDEIDALLAGSSNKPAPKKANVSALDDLDALLAPSPSKGHSSGPPPPPPPPAPSRGQDDIDDLLSGFDKPRPSPAPAKSSSAADELDALLGGMGPSSSANSNSIDDLLSGLDSGSGSGKKKQGMDAIDDLLADLTK